MDLGRFSLAPGLHAAQPVVVWAIGAFAFTLGAARRAVDNEAAAVVSLVAGRERGFARQWIELAAAAVISGAVFAAGLRDSAATKARSILPRSSMSATASMVRSG